MSRLPAVFASLTHPQTPASAGALWEPDVRDHFIDMKRFLKINAADNVAVALADDLHKGETAEVDGVGVTLRDDIARGHAAISSPCATSPRARTS